MPPDPLTTIVSTKGQVILPKAIRDQRRWAAGTRLIVEDTADGILLRTAPIFPPTRPEDVFRRIKNKGKPKTRADMEAAITAEIKERHARGRY
jgi:AbrB family looped-hinge helix DNA binding protein